MQSLQPLAAMLIPLRDYDPAHDNEYFSGLRLHSTEIIKGTNLELINLNNSIHYCLKTVSQEHMQCIDSLLRNGFAKMLRCIPS